MAKHGDGGEDGEEDGQQVEADRQFERHKMSHHCSGSSPLVRISSQFEESTCRGRLTLSAWRSQNGPLPFTQNFIPV